MVVRRGKPNFTEGPIFWRLLLFTLPIIMTGLLQVAYTMADNIVVGQFSGDPEALAAVGQTATFNGLIVNLFIGISSGASVVVAQLYGANRKNELSRCIHTSMTLSLIMGAGLCALALVLTRPILSLIANPQLLDKSSLYMYIVCAGFPALSVYNFGASIVRALGDSKTPLIILGLSGLLNVGLNLVFVIALHMSIVGVALATVISQYISAIAIVLLMMRQSDEATKYDPKNLMIDKRLLGRVMYCGVPAGLQSSVFSLSNMILTSAVSTFPVETISANTIASNIDGITYTCMNSFTSSIVTFVGQNYGAMKKSRVWRTLGAAIIQVTVIGIAIAQLELLFDEQIASLFVTDETVGRDTVISETTVIMRSVLPLYFICGVMGVMAGFLRGLGNSTGPMLSAVGTVMSVRLIWIYVFFPMNKESISWLFRCYPITWIITTVIDAVLILFAARKLSALGKPKESESDREKTPSAA